MSSTISRPGAAPARPTAASSTAPRRAERPARRAYRAPVLHAHGDVRGVTLGATPGVGDSANPMLFRP